MCQLHNLNVDIEAGIGCPIVQRQHAIDPFHLTNERQQFRLAPDDYLAGYFPQALGEADELDSVPKPVITTNKHGLVVQFFASPYPLEMPLTGVLDRAGKAIFP